MPVSSKFKVLITLFPPSASIIDSLSSWPAKFVPSSFKFTRLGSFDLIRSTISEIDASADLPEADDLDDAPDLPEREDLPEAEVTPDLPDAEVTPDL
mmetsp:Transcript_19036/g.28440  ORF Transcript_19036/g.28440 Transcript_19036/m.28440 type:complete len:97 (+) Transcript_19036:1255-1545(+)